MKARTAKGPSSQCVGSKETLAACGHHERWGLFGSQALAKHPPRLLCDMRGILPTSYTFSSDVLNVGSNPFASGGYDDVYEGSLDGSRVCVKRVRVHTRCQRHSFPCLPSLTKLTGLLPETLRKQMIQRRDGLAIGWRAGPGKYSKLPSESSMGFEI